MSNIKFKDWIKKVKDFQKNPIKYLEPFVIDMAFSILYQMAYHQIPDTGQSRSLIIKKFAEKYNKDISYFENQLWNYWNNAPERNWNDVSDSSLSVDKDNNKISFINIIGETKGMPIKMQNKFGMKPSYVHPRPNNGQYIPFHLDFVEDAVNSGDFSKVEGLESIIKKMEEYVAKEILHGRVV